MDIDKTASSLLLEIEGPSRFVTGKKESPVTNIECALGMCKIRYKKNQLKCICKYDSKHNLYTYL